MSNTQREISMYGLTEADIREQYINGLTARLSGLEMTVASILSDCQEELHYGGNNSNERVRKNLNIAKFILFEMMDAKR